ncbi:MAG: S41 family peptidase [Bacteroidales bacterium]|nr:S41 family peptidase [Candidatus Latescibacterota bacterium]
MRSKVLSRILIISLLILATASTSNAQRTRTARPGSLPPIDSAARAAIIDSITVVIDSIYVLGEPAARIVAELKRASIAGEYDEISDPALFAQRLYEDCQRVSHDGHFRIYALPPLDPSAAAARQSESPADVELRKRFYREINYGFKKAEILPGGVGYIRFDSFSRGDEAFKAATAAMNFISNSNAVIIDLRHNGGGVAAMIRFICGYLFEDETHLINWDIRAEKKTVQSYSADFVPGQRIIDQPVYILTSKNTFSAAEEFTFDLRNLERAIVVGDTTGGGGHTVQGYTFDFDTYRIGIRVPYGRAYNPLNNEGWEGVGVIPHIPVPADQALDAAYADALAKQIADEPNERARVLYEWALQDLEGRLNPMEITRKQMKKYTGSFGPRKIFVENGKLWYQRENGPRHRLLPLGEDLFRVGDLDYFRLTFECDKKGKAQKVIGLYDNGRRDENERGGN